MRVTLKGFKRNDEASNPPARHNDIVTTSTIIVNPCEFRDTLGEPHPGDGCNTTGEYLFVSDKSLALFHIFDWQQTTLFDPRLTDPLRFWTQLAPVMLCLSCRVEDLKEAVELICEIKRLCVLQINDTNVVDISNYRERLYASSKHPSSRQDS